MSETLYNFFLTQRRGDSRFEESTECTENTEIWLQRQAFFQKALEDDGSCRTFSGKDYRLCWVDKPSADFASLRLCVRIEIAEHFDVLDNHFSEKS